MELEYETEAKTSESNEWYKKDSFQPDEDSLQEPHIFLHAPKHRQFAHFYQTETPTSLKSIQKLIEELQLVQKRLGKVESDVENKLTVRFRTVSTASAKKVLISYMKEQKKRGITNSSVFELSQKLELPAPQIEEVLNDLQKEKKVKLSI